VDAGRIPDHILTDTKLAAHLPAFFRTLSGNEPSRVELDDLIQALRAR
jgi:hypothetical protein